MNQEGKEDVGLGIDNLEFGIDEVWQFMDELRGIAKLLLAGESKAHTVRPTALVLSALRRNRPKDKEWEEVTWKNQRYFFKVMHTHMMWCLRDRARRRNALKRPKTVNVKPEDLDYSDLPRTMEQTPERIVALDEALMWLRNERPELAEIIQHRFFTGLSTEETGVMLGVSRETIKRRWRVARTLLAARTLKHLNGDAQEDSHG